MIELKPCPFCGGTDVHLIPTGIGAPPRWCVVCYGCHTEGPVDLGESGAVGQWNTCPVEDALRFELDIWERKSKNNGLAAMIGLERMNELESKTNALQAEVNRLHLQNAALRGEATYWREKYLKTEAAEE